MATGVRFDNAGPSSCTVRITENDIQTVDVELVINSQNDDPNVGGYALSSVSFNNGERTETRTMSTSNDEARITLKLNSDRGRDYTLTYSSLREPNKDSDDRLSFRDNDGDDTNATIKLNSSNVTRKTTTDNPPPVDPEVPGDPPLPPPPPPPPPECVPVPPVQPPVPVCPTPIPWSTYVPTCAGAPALSNSAGGLQITKASNNQVVLNLKNYANKLVTLKITHQTSGSWVKGFAFSVPNCSDMVPDFGGVPYNKAGYSNPGITGTNTFYLYNVDGGDYNYLFTSTSVPGPRPVRTNYNLTSSTSTQQDNCGNSYSITDYACVPFQETYTGQWPACTPTVAISKNGGDEVRWVYEDGSGNKAGGQPYAHQVVTVKVEGVRNAVPAIGSVCFSNLKNSVWVPDPANILANGNCVSDYSDYSSKIRFRVPAIRSSLLSIQDPACLTKFRQVAGAVPPSEISSINSGIYSVFHLFDDLTRTTTALVSTNGVLVQPQGESDFENFTNIDTDSRNHYLVTFTDNTIVNSTVSNIDVTVGQQITAGGVGAGITVSRKQFVSASSFKVWFFKDFENINGLTTRVDHEFDDDLNTTTSLVVESPLVDVQVIAEDDDNSTEFNSETRKHYRITFRDETIVEANGSNIEVFHELSRTASGEVSRLSLSKKVRVDDKVLDVWFSKPDPVQFLNEYPAQWAIFRSLVRDTSTNTFVQTWSMSK